MNLGRHGDDGFGGGEEVAVAGSVRNHVVSNVIQMNQWLGRWEFDAVMRALRGGKGVGLDVPDERAQLISVLGRMVTELLFELLNYGDGELERIFPGIEGARIGGFGCHCRDSMELGFSEATEGVQRTGSGPVKELWC